MPQGSEQLKKAKAYAFLLLRFRPRSINEFREKLSRRGFNDNIVDELTSDFKKRGLLNDAKFARMWLADRMSLKSMGRLKIKQELKEKGVSEFDIDDVVDSAEGQIDEYETAKKLAGRRIRQFSGLDKTVVKRRLFGYLQRRGFCYEAVSKAVRAAMKDESLS